MDKSKANRYKSSTERFAAYDRRKKRLQEATSQKLEKLMAKCSYVLK
jgi:hypothetical protein